MVLAIGSAAFADDAFKLGGTGPLTGGAAIYGNAAKNGAEIAAEEINALGGIQIELKYEDDTHDAEKAINAYNTLKDWGMQISLGSVTSKPCEATSAETFEDRIFALTPSASSVAVVEGKDNMFQMCFTDPNQGSLSAQYIVDKGLASKVAVIWKNDDVYSKGIYENRLKFATDQKITLANAFEIADDVLQQAVSSISDLIKNTGFINLDFADVTCIMKDAGFAHMGVGHAAGKGKAEDAARMAVSSPLMETSINGARGVLINISGSEDMTLEDVESAANLVQEAAHPDANIIFGASFDPELQDEIRVTVIATMHQFG